MVSYISFVAGLFGAILIGHQDPLWMLCLCILCGGNLFCIVNDN